jgi:hypothetical protein
MSHPTFIRRIITRPPQLFPWVALFHIVQLCYSIWLFHTEPFPSKGWVQPLWLLCYTFSWVMSCDLKRWAAYSYTGLTALNLLLHFVIPGHNDKEILTNALFPADILFTFFLMFYIKRFD